MLDFRHFGVTSERLARQQLQQYNETDKEKEAADNPRWGYDLIRVADTVSQEKPKHQSNCAADNAGDTRQKVKQHFNHLQSVIVRQGKGD
jgi:hypothetical protein